MNKYIIIIIFTFFLVSSVTAEHKIEAPLKKIPEEIKSFLIEYTPLGSSNEQVLNFVQNQLKHITKKGVVYRKKSLATYRNGQKTIRGSIHVLLGERGRSIFTLFLVSTKIYAEWIFDQQGILVDLRVSKEGDGP